MEIQDLNIDDIVLADGDPIMVSSIIKETVSGKEVSLVNGYLIDKIEDIRLTRELMDLLFPDDIPREEQWTTHWLAGGCYVYQSSSIFGGFVLPGDDTVVIDSLRVLLKKLPSEFSFTGDINKLKKDVFKVLHTDPKQ